MRGFEHINAKTVDEAVAKLNKFNGTAKAIAGGTDLLGALRDEIWPDYPKVIINLKSIEGLSYIKEETKELKIGALTTLTDIADSVLIKKKYTALANAALRTGSPLLRNLGTLAGNICQENRCWYFRYPHKLGGRIDCARKGGRKCPAVQGDNRYHSIFGAVNKCIAVNPSDTAPALVVLAAKIKTSKRSIDIDDFFTAQNGVKSTVLDNDEIVTEIQIPKTEPETKTAFQKIALRKTIDFAIVNCSVSISVTGSSVSQARICLNGVYNNPYRAAEAEAVLTGHPIDETSARQAAEAAVASAKPLPMNRYKIQMTKTLVLDTILEACKRL
jgi:xanthine dehydrogenase YagS FAD-binding subunit